MTPAHHRRDGAALAFAADHDWQRILQRLGDQRSALQAVVDPVEVGALIGEEAGDHRASLLQHVGPVPRRSEFDAVAAVLVLLPSRAEAQHQTPPADVVDRGGLLGQHRRVAVGVAGDHRPMRTRGTAIARAASSVQHSWLGSSSGSTPDSSSPYPPSGAMKWSGSHRPSQPLASAARLTASMCSQSFLVDAQNPNRIVLTF